MSDTLDKMKFETPDMTAENIEKIAELFPNCVTEMRDESGKVKRGINFEVLKQMLSSDVVDGDECYEFTWVGKKASIAEANKPIRKTLRPCPEESKDWDTTENLYIEGDNLEVLKLLQESYLGKVKMIYIDPPYNTGNDFIYADDFMRSQKEENEQMGMYDEEDNRLFKNTDSTGRFHSNWCSMMYSRLMLARNLLTEDGIMFVSIDDNELDNLINIINEIFMEKNLINIITIKTNETKGLKNAYVNKGFPKNKEYLLVIAKNAYRINFNSEKIKKSDEELRKYMRYYNKYIPNISDDCSKWTIRDFSEIAKGKTEDEVFYLKDSYKSQLIYFVSPDNIDTSKIPQERNRFYKVINNKGSVVYYYRNELGEIFTTLFLENNYYKNLGDLWIDISTININKETCGIPTYANGQKPIKLLERLIKYVINGQNNEIIMDFFSGSATTAHAVLELNSYDNGNRSFIMVQLQENLDWNLRKQTPDQRKNTQKIIDFLESINKDHIITEYGKERIRRAGAKIKAENGLAAQNLDIGFRVLKLADSNMKDVYYAADDYKQADLLDMVSNIKDDRTDLDLLFGCLIDWGLPLSMPYTSEQIEGCTVHTYNDGDLIACFDANIPESVVKEIASRKPLRAVFRDSSFASSPAKINVFEIFKLYMPEDADDISKRVRVI